MTNEYLERVAKELRVALGFDTTSILNPNDLENLIESIQKKLKGFKVIRGKKGRTLALKNGKNFKMYIDGNREKQFYDLVEQLAFAILFDKNQLNYYELQYTEFHFPRYPYDNDAECLMLAFMMPREAFLKEMVKYESGNGSRIDIIKMSEDLNKYCERRGRHLGMWT